MEMLTPKKTYNIEQELLAMGYEIPSQMTKNFSISVAAFVNDSIKSKKVASFVSEGLRTLASSSTSGIDGIGSELVIQLPISEIDSVSLTDSYELDSSKFPPFLGQILALGALLICCSKNNQIPQGVVVNLDSPISTNSFLGALIAYPFSQLGQRQRDASSYFYYSAITLITPDEANLIGNNQKYLLSLFLRRKGYDQIISTKRRSVCRQTVCAPINATPVFEKKLLGTSV